VRRLIDAVLCRQAQWAARNNAIWCDAMARDLVALADDDGGVHASHLAAASPLWFISSYAPLLPTVHR